MNQMPYDWKEQLQAIYPARSGPCAWHGMKMLLAVRRALLETSWERIMEGVRGYAKWCKESGKEGSEFVVAPKTFFDDAIYLEELTHQAPADPRVAEARAKEAAKRASIEDMARSLGIAFDGRDSTASIETRIRLEQDGLSSGAVRVAGTGSAGAAVSGQLASRISDIADRMKHPALGGQTRRGG